MDQVVAEYDRYSDKELYAALQQTLRSQQGELLLEHLKRCYSFYQPIPPDRLQIMAYREGQRSVVLDLYALMVATEEDDETAPQLNEVN